jgi:hypothetical protein
LLTTCQRRRPVRSSASSCVIMSVPVLDYSKQVSCVVIKMSLNARTGCRSMAPVQSLSVSAQPEV